MLPRRGILNTAGRTAAPMRLTAPLEDVMRHQRAVRRYKPDPVPDDLMRHLLDLAIRAPSGTNQQRWQFIVVRDPKVKARIGALNRTPARLFSRVGRFLRRFGKDPVGVRALDDMDWQTERFEEIPVVVVACYRGVLLPFFVQKASFFASILPAVQNLLLAAGAAGLGAVLITLPLWRVGALRRALGLPWNVMPCAVVPMGWPVRPHGPNKRAPVDAVIHLDRYGQPFPSGGGGIPPTSET